MSKNVETQDKKKFWYITPDGVTLKSFSKRLYLDRDLRLDTIKVASYSEDQANSACNLIKSLYKNLDFLVQAQMGKVYKSSSIVNVVDEETNKALSDIIYELVFRASDYESVDPNYKGSIEPIWCQLHDFMKYIRVIMYHVGASDMHIVPAYDLEDCINYLVKLQKMIEEYHTENKA